LYFNAKNKLQRSHIFSEEVFKLFVGQHFINEFEDSLTLGKLKDIQVNIGLGKGKALNTFNERILNFQEIK